MTVAEVPPASAVSFDKKEKKRQPDDCGGGASGQRRLVRQKKNKTLKHNQPGDGGDASGQ